MCTTVCCSVLQCVAVCCIAVCCSVLQCVAVCCSVLHCSVLQCVALCSGFDFNMPETSMQYVYSSVLQCVAVCCSVFLCFQKAYILEHFKQNQGPHVYV